MNYNTLANTFFIKQKTLSFLANRVQMSCAEIANRCTFLHKMKPFPVFRMEVSIIHISIWNSLKDYFYILIFSKYKCSCSFPFNCKYRDIYTSTTSASNKAMNVNSSVMWKCLTLFISFSTVTQLVPQDNIVHVVELHNFTVSKEWVVGVGQGDGEVVFVRVSRMFWLQSLGFVTVRYFPPQTHNSNWGRHHCDWVFLHFTNFQPLPFIFLCLVSFITSLKVASHCLHVPCHLFKGTWRQPSSSCCL